MSLYDYLSRTNSSANVLAALAKKFFPHLLQYPEKFFGSQLLHLLKPFEEVLDRKSTGRNIRDALKKGTAEFGKQEEVMAFLEAQRQRRTDPDFSMEFENTSCEIAMEIEDNAATEEITEVLQEKIAEVVDDSMEVGEEEDPSVAVQIESELGDQEQEQRPDDIVTINISRSKLLELDQLLDLFRKTLQKTSSKTGRGSGRNLVFNDNLTLMMTRCLAKGCSASAVKICLDELASTFKFLTSDGPNMVKESADRRKEENTKIERKVPSERHIEKCRDLLPALCEIQCEKFVERAVSLTVSTDAAALSAGKKAFGINLLDEQQRFCCLSLRGTGASTADQTITHIEESLDRYRFADLVRAKTRYFLSDQGGGQTKVNRELAILWKTPNSEPIKTIFCTLHTMLNFLGQNYCLNYLSEPTTKVLQLLGQVFGHRIGIEYHQDDIKDEFEVVLAENGRKPKKFFQANYGNRFESPYKNAISLLALHKEVKECLRIMAAKKTTGRFRELFDLLTKTGWRQLLLEMGLLALISIVLANPFWSTCSKRSVAYKDGISAFDSAINTVDKVLGRKNRPEDSYVRLWRMSKGTATKDKHEQEALAFLDDLVSTILVGHTSFPRVRIHVNNLCHEILTRVRIKIQKDRILFLEVGAKDGEELVMSNQKTEAVFADLKFMHSKCISLDNERANSVIQAKQNKLFEFLEESTPSEKAEMLQQARQGRKRREKEVSMSKKAAKVAKLEKARDQAKI